MRDLLELLRRLKESKIHYSLDHCREDAVMVSVAVPGERWEIEYISDGSVEIEVFRSNGDIKGKAELERLFKEYAD